MKIRESNAVGKPLEKAFRGGVARNFAKAKLTRDRFPPDPPNKCEFCGPSAMRPSFVEAEMARGRRTVKMRFNL